MQEDSTKDESTKKAAIYVRDSSTGPDAGNSLQAACPIPPARW